MESNNLKIFTKQSIFFLTAVFIFLFFGWQALAATCKEPPDYNEPGSCDLTIGYRDTGGSGLAECKYRVESNTTETIPWTPATCSGTSTDVTVTLNIGEGLDCRHSGEGACKVYWWAKDNAGNEDNGLYQSLNIQLNRPPTIISVSDSPDPIYPGDSITFSVDWFDPDTGEQIKIHLCKTDAISDQTCPGGFWCDSPAFTTSDPATCSYTTASGDVPISPNNYYAFVCDDDGACSPTTDPNSGAFTVTWCIPPATGDWEIPAGVECILVDKNYTVDGNIIIESTGTLDLRGTTNITFSGSPRYIYIYSGGNLYQSGTAGFNR